jgi:hypothetical protein
MRAATYIAVEGSVIVGLALLSVTLGCVLRFLRPLRTADISNERFNELSFPPNAQARRPVFLSREGIGS